MTDNQALQDRSDSARLDDGTGDEFHEPSDRADVPPPPREPGPPQASGSRRPGRLIAGSAAVLALMIGSGVAGGWAASEFTDNTTTTTSAAPVTVQPAPATEQGSLAGIVAAVQPSVVSINTGSGEGSGVIIDKEGHILTNNHVVATAAGNTVTVTFNDGSSQQATIVGADPRSDLAVVKVGDGSKLTPATFGDSDAVRVGDTVLALGSPLGLEGSVTSGIISAKNRTIHETDQQSVLPSVTSISGLLQTDAAINPGNSGGALVNTAGQVVGINSAIATTGNGGGNIGLGFAIPSNTAKTVANQLIGGKPVAHPFLGVALTDAGNTGALIQSVEPNSPAAQAGLQPGDVITKIDNHSVHSADDAVAAIQGSAVGKQVTITYLRGGAEHTTTATLSNGP